MKNIWLLPLLLLGSLYTRGSGLDSTGVDRAKAIALRVDASINRYDVVKKILYKKEIEDELKLLHNYTTSIVDGIYDGNNILKITSQSEGEMEVLVSEYYFKGGKLLLVKKELSIFDKALEDNGKMIRKKKFLYYFENDKLMTCLYNENLTINYSEAESNNKGHVLLKESETYAELVSKK